MLWVQINLCVAQLCKRCSICQSQHAGIVQVECPGWAQEIDCLSEGLDVSPTVTAKARAEYSQVSSLHKYRVEALLGQIWAAGQGCLRPGDGALPSHVQSGRCRFSRSCKFEHGLGDMTCLCDHTGVQTPHLQSEALGCRCFQPVPQGQAPDLHRRQHYQAAVPVPGVPPWHYSCL